MEDKLTEIRKYRVTERNARGEEYTHIIEAYTAEDASFQVEVSIKGDYPKSRVVGVIPHREKIKEDE